MNTDFKIVFYFFEYFYQVNSIVNLQMQVKYKKPKEKKPKRK